MEGTMSDDTYPEWLDQGYLGDDEDGNPIVWNLDTWDFWMGDDEEGEPIIVELP